MGAGHNIAAHTVCKGFVLDSQGADATICDTEGSLAIFFGRANYAIVSERIFNLDDSENHEWQDHQVQKQQQSWHEQRV